MTGNAPAARDILAWLRSRSDEAVEVLQRLAEAESPSDAPETQLQVREIIARELESLRFAVHRVPGRRSGGMLHARPRERDATAPAQLILGHYDTVWPVGTLVEMPFTRDGDRISGPGVYDMKGGVVQALLALQALQHFGIEATVDGRRVEVGAGRYMRRLEYEHASFEEAASKLADEGKSPIYAAVDGKVAAILAVADPLKDGSRDAVDALHALGLKVAIVTGDNARTAAAIAAAVGIDQVMADVLPEDKAEAVKRLQSDGRRVAFVGDGINDAPALAQADVGVAIGTGTDIAIETGDVILMSGDLRGIVNAIALSRRTLRTIRNNFIWAYAYNVALIPVAAGVLFPLVGMLLSPMLAAAAMSVSSLFVVSNSLRLRRFH